MTGDPLAARVLTIVTRIAGLQRAPHTAGLHQGLEEPRSADFLPRHREDLPCVHGGDAFTWQ